MVVGCTSGPLVVNPFVCSRTLHLLLCAFHPSFCFSFSNRWIDLSCEPGAWLGCFSLALVWGCTCSCNHLLNSFSWFLLLGGLLNLDSSTRCQILVDLHSTAKILRVSSPPFFCHRLFLYCCSNLVYKRMGIHSVCSLFSFWLLLCSREALLFFLL